MPDSEEVDAGASPAVVGSSTGKEPIASPSAVRRFPDGGTGAGPSDRSSSPSALQMGWLEVTTATERLREIDAARGNTPLKRPVSGAGGAFFVEEPVDSDSARHRDRGWSARGSAGAGPSSSFSGDRNIPRSLDARDESPRTGTALWRIAQKKLRTVAAFQKSLVPRGAGDPRSGDDGAAGARAGPSDVTANMDAQMDAWLRQTVERMPVKPDHISGVRGPLMNVSKVDDKTVDVTMTTSFRAHFSQPISKLGATVATGAKGEGGLPELEGPPSPGTDRRARIREIGDEPLDGFSAREDEPDEPLRVFPEEGALVAVGGRLGGGGSIPGADGRFAIMSPDDYVGRGDGSGGSPGVGSPAAGSAATNRDGAASVRATDVALYHSMGEWEMRPSDLRLLERIAVGGFAEVFRATWKGTMVAVKQLLERGPDVVARLREEALVLARLRHPNLLLFMGWCAEPPLIATEFMRRGSLHNILRRNGGPLSPPRTHHVAVSVARGMQYLHSRAQPILHLDLKSPNILLDDKWRVKIADFGLARVRRNTLLSGRSNFHGTPEWMAPEMLRAERYDERADVYSFGVVLWELLSAQTPWNELHPMQVVAVVGYSERRLTLPPAATAFADENLVTRVIGDLFWECASKDQGARPTFDDALGRLERAPNLLLPGPAPRFSVHAGEMGRAPGPERGAGPGPVPATTRETYATATTEPRVSVPPSPLRRREGADAGPASASDETGARQGGLRIEEILEELGPASDARASSIPGGGGPDAETNSVDEEAREARGTRDAGYVVHEDEHE